MPYLKKLIFAIPFLLSMAVFGMQSDIFLKDLSILFSLDLNLLYKLIYYAASIVAAAYFFIIFAVLSSDWKIVLPVAAIGSAAVLLYISPPTGYYLTAALFLTFCASFFLTFNKVSKEPSSFQVSTHINKPAGQLITILVLVISFMIYLSAIETSKEMVQKLIDSVVNLSSEFVNQQQLPQVQAATAQGPTLTADQINLLKQNPELLKQAGIDPAILNQLEKTQTSTPVSAQSIAVAAAKPMITAQINNFIKPYESFIPFLIAFLFYLNFQFFTSIVSLVFSPITYLLFYILEKVGFIKFDLESRQVKKLVV